MASEDQPRDTLLQILKLKHRQYVQAMLVENMQTGNTRRFEAVMPQTEDTRSAKEALKIRKAYLLRPHG